MSLLSNCLSSQYYVLFEMVVYLVLKETIEKLD